MNRVRDYWRRAEQVLAGSVAARIAAGVLLVLVTFAVRALIDPIMRPGVYYHLYYPAVILSAYLFGARAGIAAVALSGIGAFLLFGAPHTGLRWQPSVYLPLGTFFVSSTAAVLILGHVRDRLNTLTSERATMDALTRGQAELFREHAGRVSDHLQLIAALLQARSREAPQAAHSRVLMNAASRTLLISRMHRSFVSDGKEAVDFNAFALRLVDAALAARGRPPITVSVEGSRLVLPLEQATSLGLVLLECINARAVLGAPGVLRVTLTEEGRDGVLRIVEENAPAADARDATLFGAIAEQMRGSLVVSADQDARMLQLRFPTELQPVPAWDPLQPLH